jgi:hypothetical protein
MSIESAQPPDAMATLSQSWNEVWLKALTKPSEATYQDFISRPGVSVGRACTWIFLGTFIASIFSFLGVYLSGSLSNLGAEQNLNIAPGLGLPLLLFVCGLVARVLGGTGTFPELSYALSAYLAPLGIVTSLLGMVPYLSCLNAPLGIYGLFLNVLAVKSVYRFGWGKAAASSLALLALILVFVACIMIVVLALLGPAIGGVYSNILQGLITPMP